MLAPSIITAAYFGTPEPGPRIALCGCSAVAFDQMLVFFSTTCASRALAIWMAWERRSTAEGLQRIRELH